MLAHTIKVLEIYYLDSIYGVKMANVQKEQNPAQLCSGISPQHNGASTNRFLENYGVAEHNGFDGHFEQIRLEKVSVHF